MSEKKNFVVYLSTYPPRECGIATFTQDLANAFDLKFNPKTKSKIIALNESPTSFYNYPSRVIDSIGANNLENYVALAEKLNRAAHIKIVNIQHEFGLFGGEWGDYIIPFLQALRKPAVVTFHSVLQNPDDHLKKTVSFIAHHSKALIVMNERSKDTLESEYGVSRGKIHLIPHGVPPATFEFSKDIKQELGLGGKTVLSTFGMLSRDKGVEYAIRALPPVIREHPNTVYLIIGATHPLVRNDEGESYRNFLQYEVERLGLKDHVQFYNKYLTIDEIVKYLKASDIYVSTPINTTQSVSGTLSYALGCGRASISTATEYAKHVVQDGRNGKLVKVKNSSSITRALLDMLSDEKRLRHMHKEAYELSRHMTWPNVAAAHFKIYEKFADIEPEPKKLPIIKFDHLKRMTDGFGIAHHARFSRPEKRFGYSLDDNARALIAAALYYKTNPDPSIESLMKTYLNYITFVQRKDGSLANIVNSRKQKDQTRDEDVQGRGIWALGFVSSADYLPKEITKEAAKIFSKLLKTAHKITSPRAMAFAITGLYHCVNKSGSQKHRKLFNYYAVSQLKNFEENSSDDWPWFEDSLTYSNSKLPESMFYAYEILKNKKYLKVAESSLGFLDRITFGNKYYMPIGQNGWYFRYKKRAYFDQHPEDAASMVQTKLAAYKATNKKSYLDGAVKAFRWFLGDNHLSQMVYDEVTGGCNDGLGQYGLNLNQGAESTISYLLARLALEDTNINQS